MPDHDPLAFDVFMALTKGLKPIRGVRLDEGQRHRVAARIVEHLRRANWRIEPGKPAEPAAGGAQMLQGPPVAPDRRSTSR